MFIRHRCSPRASPEMRPTQVCASHPPPKRRWPAFLVATLMIGVVAACTDRIADPLDQPGPSLSVTADADPPMFVPNGVPYRNPDYKHATGRAGDATLTTRALIDQDGTTSVEVTTGALDGSDPPPYTITNLQFKLFALDGETVDTIENDNDVNAGSVTYTYPNRPWHSQIQVQGHVLVPNASGTKERIGVVTAYERVNRLPDLSVTSLTGATQVEAQSLVSFTVTVAELNGDLGGTADCVLYIDEAEVDRVEGMWVAEAGNVACAFLIQMSDVGTHVVEARVENVTPGDWDEANNSASYTIEVVSIPLSGSLAVEWTEYEATLSHTAQWVSVCGAFCVDNSLFEEHVGNESNTFSAELNGTVADHTLQAPFSFEISEYVNGVVAASHQASGVGDATSCTTVWTGNASLWVCPDGPVVQFERYTQEAVYWSSSLFINLRSTWYVHCHPAFYDCHTHRNDEITDFNVVNYYSSVVQPPEGVFPPLGASYGVGIHLTGFDGAEFTAGATVASYTSGHDSGYPASSESCHSITGGEECVGSSADSRWTRGSTTF